MYRDRPARARRCKAAARPTTTAEEAEPLDGESAFADIFADLPELERAASSRRSPSPTPAAPSPSLPKSRGRSRSCPLEPADEASEDDITAALGVNIVADRTPYQLPNPSILQKSKATGVKPNYEPIARQLVEALANFGVEARLIGMVDGPRVTRFELQLAPGTKVSRVSALRDDLAYALATTEIRILAPIPGKQAVGVEVPNTHLQHGHAWATSTRRRPRARARSPRGSARTSRAQGVSCDLARMPHLLIAGTTGAGKSGCINAILSSILLRATPDEVRMILVDPKRVELNHYETIPHLLTPVVTNMKNASLVLQNIVREMESRYELMGAAKARNLVEMNRGRAARGEDTVPYVLVVIDELADLMMVAPAEVEDAIIRLAQKSRAVGIHLVLATQSPRVDVITGMIKANVPSRIAFAVSSQTDSRVILDVNGAEALLGQGDMLYKPLGTSKLQRVQGAYISEDETRLIVESCRRQGEPDVRGGAARRALRRASPSGSRPTRIPCSRTPSGSSPSIRPPRCRSCSAACGWATRGPAGIIDMLERRGIVSGYEGSKARKVLITEADLTRILGDREPAPVTDEDTQATF